MGKFTFIETSVPGIVIIEPTVFGDSRGYFMETWQKEEFAAAGITGEFVQDNQSLSTKGVLRGLHFQRQHTQGKLVRVIQGRVFDVGVDVRPGSPHFGAWAGAELSDENSRQLWVPPGFAHGFLVLSETAAFVYKCTDVYDPGSEGGIRFDDPDIGIEWPDLGAPPKLSEKDAALPSLKGQDFSDFERWLP
ncbi:dTDP-4-dehydrorhamnose 3,5-epimerase [Ruminococcaceae bacterium OttesenSCG-928-I18]|nr:dTDP-4-dehydrorhamnose 3,5-epimerase [Ruminococcaceae bacterium OttesenSCG-928-I18]